MAWLMLSFGSAFASAVSVNNSGWLRLCSSAGASWQLVDVDSNVSQQSVCQCLTHTLIVPLEWPQWPAFTPYYEVVLQTQGEPAVQALLNAQPRAPPILL